MKKRSRWTIQYPQGMGGLPVFPSPSSWFGWKQRYIYRIAGTESLAFMDGYGELHADRSIPGTGEMAKQNVWLKSPHAADIASINFMSTTVYQAACAADTVGLTWHLHGLNRSFFDAPLISFDYPIVLGKSWISRSTIKSIIPVRSEGKVIAFIPADLKSHRDIIVAPGEHYELPFAIDQIPKPRQEINQPGFTPSWSNLTAQVDKPSSETDWHAIRIPNGPRAGEVVTGYYVTKIKMSVAGITLVEQEIWKDVRGCVPVYVVDELRIFARKKSRTIKIAKVWSGNDVSTDSIIPQYPAD